VTVFAWIYENKSLILSIILSILAILAALGTGVLAASRFFRKERRLFRNMDIPVFLVEEKAGDMQDIADRLIVKDGMFQDGLIERVKPAWRYLISGAPFGPQVQRVMVDDLKKKLDNKPALVVVYYKAPPIGAGSANKVLEKVIEVVPASMTILVYAPDNKAVTPSDWKVLNERGSAVSNLPIRLMSDIWAAMCILPMNPKESTVSGETDA